jgi:large subunit ribosomal protein L22
MGARKRIAAEERKEAKKTSYFAQLNDCPTSPRKMRLMADIIRGMGVEKASSILQHSSKEAARRLEKLLWSAIHNFEAKSGERWENSGLFVKEITVDGGASLKRLRTAPQGRGYRVRKRSNHVKLVLDSINASVAATNTETTTDNKTE